MWWSSSLVVIVAVRAQRTWLLEWRAVWLAAPSRLEMCTGEMRVAIAIRKGTHAPKRDTWKWKTNSVRVRNKKRRTNPKPQNSPRIADKTAAAAAATFFSGLLSLLLLSHIGEEPPGSLSSSSELWMMVNNTRVQTRVLLRVRRYFQLLSHSPCTTV